MQPTSSTFRMLAGAGIAYGLTDGGYNAAQISVQPLARRILQAVNETDDAAARLEAMMKPRVMREFLTKYDGNRFPREEIAKNVLVTLGVPQEAVGRTLKLIVDGARDVGVFQDINGVTYVNLKSLSTPNRLRTDGERNDSDDSDTYELPASSLDTLTPDRLTQTTIPSGENRRVFITHGKNKSFIDPLKDLLIFGELEPVVLVERETVSQPVPDKVMNDMRSCSAAIIHVDADERLITSEGETRVVLNPNVLIEIGAAMALYGRRVILLVKHGVELPFNLQGLYEVRYDGDKLGGEESIKLLKAMKDIKNHPLPGSP